MTAAATSCGFAAIAGAPNAGKSTLLNCLLGRKLAITSPKPQTTRTRILGILTWRRAQICLLDTPGIFAPRGKFDRAMVSAAWQSMQEADMICLLVDAARGLDPKTRRIVAQLRKEKKSAVLVLNKIDLIAKAKILPLADALQASGVFTDTFMIAAKTGDGVSELKKHLATAMPPGPWQFAAGQTTDLTPDFMAAEITREQIMRQLAQELPYAAAVLPAGWEERRDGSLRIEQRILVMRDGQKAIMIGKHGAMLKRIGATARRALEKSFGRKVHLFLEVEIEPDWQLRRGLRTEGG